MLGIIISALIVNLLEILWVYPSALTKQLISALKVYYSSKPNLDFKIVTAKYNSNINKKNFKIEIKRLTISAKTFTISEKSFIKSEQNVKGFFKRGFENKTTTKINAIVGCAFFKVNFMI